MERRKKKVKCGQLTNSYGKILPKDLKGGKKETAAEEREGFGKGPKGQKEKRGKKSLATSGTRTGKNYQEAFPKKKLGERAGASGLKGDHARLEIPHAIAYTCSQDATKETFNRLGGSWGKTDKDVGA